MAADFQLLGPAHVGILASVPLLGAGLAIAQRRLLCGRTWPRRTLAWAILSDTALWYGYMALHHETLFPDRLPLELCDASLVLCVIALLTLRPVVFDVVYYTGIAGTSMALITPNLWEPFPSVPTIQFFIAHGLTLAGVLYLLWSGQARPRPGSVGRAMLFVNLWAGVAGAADWAFKTNFMYLRAKPDNPSLLDLLGPWPWYILSGEGVALCLFFLLYIPFRRPVAGTEGAHA